MSDVFSVAGRYDLVAIVRMRENEELAQLISEKMLSGILMTETLIAFRIYAQTELSGMFDLGS